MLHFETVVKESEIFFVHEYLVLRKLYNELIWISYTLRNLAWLLKFNLDVHG